MGATKHVKHGSSTARRDVNCPANGNISSPELPEKENRAAARGSIAHDVMEDYMVDVDSDLRDLISATDLDTEETLAVHAAVEMVHDVLESYDEPAYMCEQFMSDPAREDVGGTPDLIAVSGTVALNVDYKFGRVAVDHWDQHLFGFMMWRKNPDLGWLVEDVDTWVAVIIQPAVSHTAKVQTFTTEQLDTYERDYYSALAQADTGTTDGFPGDWCTYCPKANYCDAKRNQVAGFLDYDPKDLQQLAQGMALVDQMKKQIKAIEGEVFAQLEANRPVPGWKLVLKKGIRRWIDTDKAWHKLRHSGIKGMEKSLYVEEKLRTAPQVVAAMKKAGHDIDLSEFITNASSGTTIAPHEDPRDAVDLGVKIPESLAKLFESG